MAFFPLAARADGAPAQYETEIPSVPNEKPPKQQENIKDPGAGASKDNDGGSTVPDGSETGEEGESSAGAGSGQDSGGGSGGSADAKSGSDGGTGQGSSGNGSGGSQAVGLGDSTQVANTQAHDDSSSPLVPILIAIAALAAISIGAVVVRQRRQRRGPGGQVSPKAS